MLGQSEGSAPAIAWMEATADGPGRAWSPLASLRGETMGNRYCAWRGASERRYIASIYPVDPRAADFGLPSFDSYVLMAVATSGEGRRILSLSVIERASDERAAVSRALADGADEWHVHFLGETAMERSVAAADLARRHLSAGDARPSSIVEARWS